MNNMNVALIFFTRPEPLSRVFQRVREAKPRRLFLIQDGPRDNKPQDIEKIAECREVVKNIDWECEVYNNYSEKNLGCGERIYTGLKWAFSMVDDLIILEDDCLASKSFFPFCEEVLEKYRNDERICMISGMNHLEIWDKVDSDYFFTFEGSIAGWATWKRCWDQVDFQMNFLKDRDVIRNLSNIAKYGPVDYKNAALSWKKKKQDMDAGIKQKSWSYQYGITSILNSQVIIVPKYNMMTNIGVTENGTNTPSNEKLIPAKVRRIYHLQLHEYENKIKHPKFVTVDYEYNRKLMDVMRPLGVKYVIRRMEWILRKLVYGNRDEILASFRRKLKK